MYQLKLTTIVLLVLLDAEWAQSRPTGEPHQDQIQDEIQRQQSDGAEHLALEPVKLDHHGSPLGDSLAKGFDLADHVVTDYEYERVLEKLRREAVANEQHQILVEGETVIPILPTATELVATYCSKNLQTPLITDKIAPSESVAPIEFSTTDCPICLEPLETGDRQAMRCGHVFHPDCISRWSGHFNQRSCICPICRRRYQIKLND